jgi:predicted Zn finger-like uncharacterized protein
MALATQCPNCHTAFRVVNDQLKLHAGIVRCGACKQTFNGIEHLLAPNLVPGQAAGSTAVHPPETPSLFTPSTRHAPASIPSSLSTPSRASGTASAQAFATDSNANATIAPLHHAGNHALADDRHIEEMARNDLHADHDAGNDSALTHARSGIETGDESAQPRHESDATTYPPLDDLVDNPDQFELETQATLMNQLDWDWSMKEDEPAPVEKTLTRDKTKIAGHATSLATTAAIPAAATALKKKSLTEQYFDPKPGSDSRPSAESDMRTYKTDTTDKADSADNAVHEDSISDELNSGVFAEVNADADKPDFVIKAERKQKHGKMTRLLTALLSLLLLLTLTAQAVYSARDTISAYFPQSKALLLKACQQLRCQIELPARIEMLSIESNELEKLDTTGRTFALSLQLQNKAATLQRWPVLELTLNDAAGKAVMRRAITPNDYLSDKNDIVRGFPAGSVQSIKIFFESEVAKAAGYHVGMFYP